MSARGKRGEGDSERTRRLFAHQIRLVTDDVEDDAEDRGDVCVVKLLGETAEKLSRERRRKRWEEASKVVEQAEMVSRLGEKRRVKGRTSARRRMWKRSGLSLKKPSVCGRNGGQAQSTSTFPLGRRSRESNNSLMDVPVEADRPFPASTHPRHRSSRTRVYPSSSCASCVSARRPSPGRGHRCRCPRCEEGRGGGGRDT